MTKKISIDQRLEKLERAVARLQLEEVIGPLPFTRPCIHELVVDAGLKLCDRSAENASSLCAGQNVRVNCSGDPHDPFMLAEITEVVTHGNKTTVHIRLEGICTYAGMVNLTTTPFSNMITKTAKVIEVLN